MVSLLKLHSYLKKKRKMDNKCATKLADQEYFFGKISRERAESILLQSGGEDGRFLIRECLSSATDFSIAVCFNNKPYHYVFRQKKDGRVFLQGGESFFCVEKMIKYLSRKPTGLITKLTHPCQRTIFGGAQVWPSISQTKALCYMNEAAKNKSMSFEEAMSQLYRKQPWFKGGMTRQESKNYFYNQIEKCNGQFVIREKADGNMALSLYYEGADYHYVIEVRVNPDNGMIIYRILPGPEFYNIMELVTYYHNYGLICPLHLEYKETNTDIPWLKKNLVFQKKDAPLLRNQEHEKQNKNRLSRSLESINLPAQISEWMKNEKRDSTSSSESDTTEVCKEIFTARKQLLRTKAETSDILNSRSEISSSPKTRVFNDRESALRADFLKKMSKISISDDGSSLFDELVITSRSNLVSLLPSANPPLPCRPRSPLKKSVEKSTKDVYPGCICGATSRGRHIVHQESDPADYKSCRKMSQTLTDLPPRPKMLSISEDRQASNKLSNKTFEQQELNTKKETKPPPKSHHIFTKDFFSKTLQNAVAVTKFQVTEQDSSTSTFAAIDDCNDLSELVDAVLKEGSSKKSSNDPLYSQNLFNPNLKLNSSLSTKCLLFQKMDLNIQTSLPPPLKTEGNILEVNESCLKMMDTLGKGHFGVVKKATLNRGGKLTEVAIKLYGCHKTVAELELKLEAKMMSLLDHENIVKMIGVCRTSDSFMLLLELASHGNLRTYLQSNRSTTVAQIVDILNQVCQGMIYLGSQNIVHRDLASRNILLYDGMLAKIGDFGLSRSTKSKSCYQFKSSRELPFKWYPLEVFNERRFSSKSDVWSYGVTMWECLSYSALPYPDLSIDEYIKFIKKGKRLKKPENCSDDLYQVMQCCWQLRQEDRPTFVELISYLKHPYILIAGDS